MQWLRFNFWTIGAHMLTWALLPVVVASFALAAGWSAYDHVRATSALAMESRDTLNSESDLLQGVVDLETGVRGYALTVDPTFLEPYENGQPYVAARLARLRDLVHDRPDQLARVDRVAALVDEWTHAFAEPIITDVQTGRDVQLVIQQGQGKRRIDAIRAELAAFEATETAILDTRLAQDAEAWRLAGLLSGVALLTLLVSSCVALLIGRRIVGSVGSFARAADQIAGGHLETRLAEEGRNELVMTGRAINHMATALADAREEMLAQNELLIAEIRQAERARGELGAILDSTSDAIVMVAPDRVFRSMNRQCSDLFGIAPGSIIGRKFEDAADVFDQIFVDAAALRARLVGTASDTSTEFSERVKQQWPACRDLALLSSPVRSERGEYLGRLYVFRDVTFEARLDEQRRQLEAERTRAAEVQADLLPRLAPILPGLQLAGRCVPALQVGGDFFDWSADDGLVWLTLGDVMGKGMAAALLMATVRSTLRAGTRERSPAAALNIAQAVLGEDLSYRDSYVTLLHAVFEPSTGRLTYVDAGHGHAVILRAGGRVERLTRRSFPLGMPFASNFEDGACVLSPGDALILYSDGLVDAAPYLDVADIARCVRGVESADEMADRLIELATGSRTPAAVTLADDLSVLVLRAEAVPTRPEAGSGDLDRRVSLVSASEGCSAW